MYHTNIQYKSLYVRGRMTRGPIPADYDALRLKITNQLTLLTSLISLFYTTYYCSFVIIAIIKVIYKLLSMI